MNKDIHESDVKVLYYLALWIKKHDSLPSLGEAYVQT